MNRVEIERLAEKLGLPYPECDNEERLLIRMASERVGYPPPECRNEEEMLLRKLEIP